MRSPASDPLVSVVIATYNRWPLVREAVDSVLAQPVGLTEIIVVDDGSTDGTAQLLELERPSVRVVRQENTERGAARNRGLRLARGPFVVFLDADDMLEPWYLSQFVERWDTLSRSERIYVCRNQLWFPESGRLDPIPLSLPGSTNLLAAALYGTVWGPGCAVVPRALAIEVEGFPEARSVANSEDWIFQVRLLATGAQVEILPCPGVRHREHPGRSTKNDLACIASAESALDLLLDEGICGRELTASERNLATAGTRRLRAAHAYRAGDMRQARRHLRDLRRRLGWRAAFVSSGRLWLQTWLGASGSRTVRRLRARLVRASHSSLKTHSRGVSGRSRPLQVLVVLQEGDATGCSMHSSISLTLVRCNIRSSRWHGKVVRSGNTCASAESTCTHSDYGASTCVRFLLRRCVCDASSVNSIPTWSIVYSFTQVSQLSWPGSSCADDPPRC